MQEILAPVGNRDMLDAALAAGCDAVYLASKNFGARAYAQNFTLEEIREIIKRCHLVNVKVHVTMNTILFEEEIESAYQVAKPINSCFYADECDVPRRNYAFKKAWGKSGCTS